MESKELKESYDHKFYQHCDEKEADALAWAFVNKEKLVKFPYKYKEMKSNEIRANVLYSGLCSSDSHHGRGKWGQISYPLAPGHEIIAEVSKIGEDVKNFKVGDKVAFGVFRDACGECKYCGIKRETLCVGSYSKFTYDPYWGGYSTQIQQPEDFYFNLPEKLDIKRAAPLLCAGITVYTPIKKYVTPGAVCAVVGIGGLGHLAVQFLSKMGYSVTAFTSSLSKKDFILSLGATEVVDLNDEGEMLMNESKFDFLINTSPSTDNFDKIFNVLAPAATYVQVGNGKEGSALPINVAQLILKEIKVIGSLVGTREDIREMLQLCADKDIYPICEEFDFEDLPKGFDKLENGKPIFRVVVNVENFSKKNNLFK